MRIFEALFFVPVAAALHVVVWDFAPSSYGSLAAGGSGRDTVTLAAATAQQSEMVARWQEAPQVTTNVSAELPTPMVPTLSTLSMPGSAAPTLPSAPGLTAPLRAALPQVDTQSTPPPARRESAAGCTSPSAHAKSAIATG